MKKKIIIISRQFATSNSFIPLINKLKDFEIINLSFKIPHDNYLKNSIRSILIKTFDDALVKLEDNTNSNIMLTGTSELAIEDNLFWEWARNYKIPSIGFVDSWINYIGRFSFGLKKFNAVPDYIAVIDVLMSNKLIELGCNKNKIKITGNPYFEKVSKFKYEQSKEDEFIKKKYGKYILFIGELFNPKVFGKNEKKKLGYTENEILKNTLYELNLKLNHELNFIYKPHPRGISNDINFDEFENLKKISFHISQMPILNLIVNSKLVIGMTSMALHESALMGKKTLSIRKNQNLINDVIDNNKNIIKISDYSKIIEFLKEKKVNPQKKIINVTEKLGDLINSVVNR